MDTLRNNNFASVPTATNAPSALTAPIRSFYESNSLVAKVTFFILIVVLFVLFLRLGTYILKYLLSPSKNPILVDGMKSAVTTKVITQHPRIRDSKPLLRSVNERDGIEFSYSVWLYLEDVGTTGKYRHIFHKGHDVVNNEGLATPLNGPGLYFEKDTNVLVLFMNTHNTNVEKVRIESIPMNKWVHVVIRLEGKNLDVYINGSIVKRHIFKSVPKQNYGNVYVNLNGGYTGLLSDLKYFNHGININKINSIVRAGPNMKMDDSIKNFPPFFSLRWYFNQVTPDGM